jgi:PAS domain S-box-containing protein
MPDAAQAALWRAMSESSGLMAGVFELLDDDYRYVLVNPPTAEFYGLRAEEMIGRTGRGLGVADDHLARRLATLRRCWETGRTVTREYPFDHHGRDGWFLGTFSPVPGPTPRVSFVLVDVTERKRAQLEAERQQARLDLALTAGGLGLWEFDLNRDVVHWDQRTRELFGVEPDAPIDYGAYVARLDPAEAPAMRATLEAALRRENGGRYTVEHQVTGRDGQKRWVRGSGQVLFDAEGRPVTVLGTVQDVTREVESREQQALMVAELNHRVKNNLATVQSLAAQTARRAGSLHQFIEDFEGRVISLARTHDVLTRNSWTGAELSVLLERELAHCRDRVRLDGPRYELGATPAVALALIIHELATNAAKYGALSAPGGRIEVSWTFQDNRLALTWRETGGPPPATDGAQGFGTRLIERLARGDLGGCAEADYAREGLVFRLEAQPRR